MNEHDITRRKLLLGGVGAGLGLAAGLPTQALAADAKKNRSLEYGVRLPFGGYPGSILG